MRRADPQLQERRRNMITAAAERCFAERGFHQTSMQEVATEAGVSLGLLYRYFDSKQSLALVSAARERAEAVAALAALHEVEEVIDALVALVCEEIREGLTPARARFSAEILAEAARNPVFASQLVAEDGAVRDGFVQLLRQQQARGRIRAELEPTALADLLLALFDGLPLRAQLYPDFDAHACAELAGRMLRAVLQP